MKKTAIIASALAGVIVLGGGSVYAANQIAKNNAIGEESARNFAYVDAGILPDNAENISTDFDFDSGRFVYEIEFNADGTNYEYKVDSKTGEIIEKDAEAISGYSQKNNAESKTDTASQKSKAEEAAGKTDKTAINNSDTSSAAALAGDIGAEQAKETALKKAGLTADKVTFTKSEADTDGGKKVYDIEFYVEGKYEYEYEIDAATGKIIEESKEPWDASDNYDKNDVTSSDKNDKSKASSQAAESSAAAGETITVDQAKEIALKKAGLTADKVKFTKAKLERDNGKPVYDIEFYVDGQYEYEYEIDAYSGSIIDSDKEPVK